MSAAHIALYGNVGIIRAKCGSCGVVGLVLDDRHVCCDAQCDANASRYKRMSQPTERRKLPPMRRRKAQLEEQDGRCYYCNLQIGSWVVSPKGKPTKLRLNWGHLVPWIFNSDNRASNFVAACHVCNGIKSSRVFKTADEARIEINLQREAKGWQI